MIRSSVLCLASAFILGGCGDSGETTGDSPTDNAGEQNAGVVAANVPELKPGLWRVTVIAETGPQFPAELICLSERQSKNKTGLGERAAELPCDSREVTYDGRNIMTNAICDVGGIKRTIQTRAHGDFQADYWVEYSEHVDPPPADGPPEIKRRIHARWLNECRQ